MMARFRLAPAVWFAALCCRRRGEILAAVEARRPPYRTLPIFSPVPPHASRRTRKAEAVRQRQSDWQAHARRTLREASTTYTWEPSLYGSMDGARRITQAEVRAHCKHYNSQLPYSPTLACSHPPSVVMPKRPSHFRHSCSLPPHSRLHGQH